VTASAFSITLKDGHLFEKIEIDTKQWNGSQRAVRPSSCRPSKLLLKACDSYQNDGKRIYNLAVYV
jgi:hypothetical protein